MRKSKVLEAIKDFNEFRSSEATAELVSIENNRTVVRISGTYCIGRAAYTITLRTSLGSSRTT